MVQIILLVFSRADYWKSQARKYCDFCKCWIADNKPSIEFHEKGRRHQDNVAKKLKYITKKSKRDEKETAKTDAVLKQIESAALEAYRRDVETNADLSSIAINTKSQENSNACAKKVWKEAKAEDGRTYYWNVLTNESLWDPPREGFMTMAEQRDEDFEKAKAQMKVIQKQRKIDARIRFEEDKKEEEEARAAAARERMKEFRASPEPEPVVSGPILPSGKTDPYGQWTKIEPIASTVDLQLPKQEFEYFEIPVEPEFEPPPKIFKEKTVETLGGGSAEFKKRKLGTCGKRNTRQRLDDD